MAREKEGYRDALERIRSYGYVEMLTVQQVALIAFNNQPTATTARKRATKFFDGWLGDNRGKLLPATMLARQMC